MTNTTMKLALAAATLAAAAPALATNGMRMIGFGPIQNSMGGTSAAMALDANTVVSNPAGITSLETRADVSAQLFMPTVEYFANSPAPGMASGATLESDRPVDVIPSLAGIFRASDAITLGLAANGTTGMGVDYGLDLYGGETTTSYLGMRISPAVAFKATERLSLGVSANLMYARMEYTVAGGMGMEPRDAAGALGYGATLGLSYAAAEGATLAVVYETKSRFQDFSFDIPSHQVMTPSGPVTVPGGTEELDFDQPDVLTVGASFRPMAALLVGLDLQLIRWSQTNGENLPVFTTNPNLTGAMPWNLDWRDQLVFKVGAQYDLSSQVKLRAGYNWGEDPLSRDRAFENVAFPAIAEHHFTVGGTYQMGSLGLNLAAVYSPKTKLSGSNGSQMISGYETSMSQLAFDVGASWKF